MISPLGNSTCSEGASPGGFRAGSSKRDALGFGVWGFRAGVRKDVISYRRC
jgi:hypothetical protein